MDTTILWADTGDPGDMVIPVGGTVGQALVKVSGSDYDTDWASAILPTIIDAKGDLIVGTAADTASRLAVGVTDNQVLTVDSSTASGFKYDAPSVGLTVLSASSGLRFIPGVNRVGWTNASLTFANGTTYYWPISVSQSVTFDAFTPFVNGAIASSLLRCALSRADSAWQPTSLVIESGDISTASTGEKVTTVSKTTIGPGRYLLAARSDSAIQLRGATVSWSNIGIGATNNDSLFFALQYMTVSESFGAFSSTPTAWTGFVSNSSIPSISVILRSAAP